MQGNDKIREIEAALEDHLAAGRKSAADDTKQLIGRIEKLEQARPSEDASPGMQDPESECQTMPGGHFAPTLSADERAAAETARRPPGRKQTGKRKS